MSDIPKVLPEDKYNTELVSNVYPPDWKNPEPASLYNLVVMGAGTAGLVSAVGAAGLGAKVALIERHLLGGDCLNYGCVPSKCLLRSARQAHSLRDAERFGVRGGGEVEVDFAAVMDLMRLLRRSIGEHDSVELFRQLGVDVFLAKIDVDAAGALVWARGFGSSGDQHAAALADPNYVRFVPVDFLVH